MNYKILLLAVSCLWAGHLTSARAEHYAIFLLAGQSNMDGRGAVKDLTGDLAQYAKPTPNILIHFSAGGLHRPLTVSRGFRPIQPGYSGTPGNKPNGLPTPTFGPEVSFGPAIAETLPGTRVLLVKFVEGGTNLHSDWSPKEKGKLYENFIKFVRSTQDMIKAQGDTCEIRGMLWHQGESDAGLLVGQYQAALTEFIGRVRGDLGISELPFVIGQVYDNGKRGNVIAAEKAGAKAVPHTGFAAVDGLTTSDQGTHFDAKSQIELGKRFAREMARLLAPAALHAADAPHPRTIVIFGDSITAGGALPEKDRDDLWLRRIERDAHGTITMLNEGKGGRPTASRSEFDAMLARQPRIDLLVIALGMNDSRDITASCVPKAVANVRYMIDRARQSVGAALPILLVGPSNINQGALGPTKLIAKQREAKLRELGDGFATLAKETNCDFVSLFGVVPESDLTRDGVHPDSAGNAAIATVMKKKIMP